MAGKKRKRLEVQPFNFKHKWPGFWLQADEPTRALTMPGIHAFRYFTDQYLLAAGRVATLYGELGEEALKLARHPPGVIPTEGELKRWLKRVERLKRQLEKPERLCEMIREDAEALALSFREEFCKRHNLPLNALKPKEGPDA